jgi:hypothetical protein
MGSRLETSRARSSAMGQLCIRLVQPPASSSRSSCFSFFAFSFFSFAFFSSCCWINQIVFIYLFRLGGGRRTSIKTAAWWGAGLGMHDAMRYDANGGGIIEQRSTVSC